MQESPGSITPQLRLLFVDNAHTDCALLARLIEVGGYTLQSARVETAAQLRDALLGRPWDAVITELELPGFTLAEVLAVLRECGPDIPCLVVSGTGDEDAAAEALVAGADDYVSKSRLARLLPALRRSIAAALARRHERLALTRLRMLQPLLEHSKDVTAVARDLLETFGELMTELSAELDGFAGNADAAVARVQNMRHAFDRARVRAEHGMRALIPSLIDLGIVQALQALAQRILQRQGIACTFDSNRTAITLDEAPFSVMYRVCQATLLLFARQPHTQSLRIELTAQAQSLSLEIADDGGQADGACFSNATFRELREAAQTLGGALQIGDTPRQGVRVILTLPYAGGG